MNPSEEERKPPTTLYEWMRDRYLERQQYLQKKMQESSETKDNPSENKTPPS